MSLYRYNAVLFNIEDKFQESETIQSITGLDSSVTAASTAANVNDEAHSKEINNIYLFVSQTIANSVCVNLSIIISLKNVLKSEATSCVDL